MASALKRKRGNVDVKDIPKRAKSLNGSQDSPVTSKLPSQAGWDAAFNPPKEGKELVHMNGTNGDEAASQRLSKSPEVMDFEEFVEQGPSRSDKRGKSKSQAAPEAKAKPSTWKLSEPIGGRMIPADPVFTKDERYVAMSHSSF